MQIIGGLFARKTLKSPKGVQTRPTASRLRESLFNICQHVVVDASFLDLYSGSGAVGFEALSRGSSKATFVESHKEAISTIKENAKLLGVESKYSLFPIDVFSALKKLEGQKKQFSIIYADPPYGKTDKEGGLESKALVEWIDAHAILEEGGWLFIEEAAGCILPIDGLKTLVFVKSRKIGAASLHHYIKRKPQSLACSL